MTAAELMASLGPRLSNTKLIVVANREPYIHLKRTEERPRRRGLLSWLGGRGREASVFVGGFVLHSWGWRRAVAGFGRVWRALAGSPACGCD